MSNQNEIEGAIEALLFVTTEPLRLQDVTGLFPDDAKEEVAAAYERVAERYTSAETHSGVMLDRVGGGIRLVTRPELHPYLAAFFESHQRARLSMAALETLAIVAYRQPITAPEIQELRGVSSASVLKTLLDHRLVRLAGRKDVVGRPFLYRTTREFLLRFGLDRLRDLPPLEELEELLAQELGDDSSNAPNRGGDDEESLLAEIAALDDEDQEGELSAEESTRRTSPAPSEVDSTSLDETP